MAENEPRFVSQPVSQSARPPLWLASAAVVAGWGAIYDIAVWFIQFARQPVHPDFRIFYVAAEAGTAIWMGKHLRRLDTALAATTSS
jgi:hypothetical protein